MTSRSIVLPLLLIASLCGFPSRAAKPPNLISRSKMLFNLAPFVYSVGSAGPSAVFEEPIWFSKNVLLAHSRLGDGFFDIPYRIDLKKRRLVPLAHLHKVINDTKGSGWKLSSDRRWLLWQRGWGSMQHEFVATRPDGSRSVRWPVKLADCEGPFYWQPRTHRWVHLVRNDASKLYEARIFDLDHPRWKQVIPLPDLDTTRLRCVLPDGSVLLTGWNRSHTDKIYITRLHLLRNRAITQKGVLPVPDTGTISHLGYGDRIQLCVSPDGKHIAWLIQQGKKRSTDGQDHPKQATLYVGHLNGKSARPVGIIPFTQDDDNYQTILHLWFQDNKRVLLEYHTRLYALPIP